MANKLACDNCSVDVNPTEEISQLPSTPDFTVHPPDWEKARALTLQAVKKAEAGDFQAALGPIEEAITLDSIAALSQFHGMRADFCEKLGDEKPRKALNLYSYAVTMRRKGRHRDAELAYQEAVRLDPLFLWPLNNLAWMLSTSKDRSVCDGPRAVSYALKACEQSNWSCWAFVGTLAAAYAAAGDFASAVGWQQANLPLVPPSHRLDAELELRHYELRKHYVDEGQEPAGAPEHGEPDASLVLPENLSRRYLRQLFQAGYFETELDDEGDLWVTDRVHVLVRPALSGRSLLLSAGYGVNEDAGEDNCLRFVNRVNCSLRLVRAFYNQGDDSRSFAFDYEIAVHGGITKKALVHSFRFFAELVATCIRELYEDHVLQGNRQ